MRIRAELVVVLSGAAAIVTMFALLRFTDWQRITVVGVSSLVIVLPLLLHGELVLRRKRIRSEEFVRDVVAAISALRAELGKGE